MSYQRTSDRNASRRAGHRPLFTRVYRPAPIGLDTLAELEADGYEPIGIERDEAGLAVEYVFVRKVGTAPTQAR
jgi:hypothetical protein